MVLLKNRKHAPEENEKSCLLTKYQREKLLRQKLLLMKQNTLEEMF